MNTFCIVDVETANFTGGILEIAAVRIDSNLNILEEMEVRTNLEWPKDHVSKLVVPIGKYTPEEAIQILKNFWQSQDIIIGFNLSFEERILHLKFLKKFDVMEYMKVKYKLLKWSMEVCTNLLKIESVERHRALGDCHTILQILKKELLIKA